MLRYFLLILITLTPGRIYCQTEQRGSNDVLTLEQAVALAISNNPGIKTAAIEIDKSADRLAASRTLRLPSFELNLLESQTLTALDFRFSKGVLGSFAATGPIPSEDLKITTPRQPTTFLFARALQPLSQQYRIGLGLKLEEVRGEIAQQKLRAEQLSAVRDVKRIYFDLLSLQSALESSEENIRLYRELDRVVGRQVAEKVVLKADGLEVSTQLASEEYTALTLRHSMSSQKEQLNALLGRDLQTEFSISPMTETTLYEADLPIARSQALENRPEIREAQLQLKLADFDQRIKRSQFIPDVSLAVTYLRIAPVSIIPPNIASVGVNLTWEPFDWGRKKHELSEKIRNAEQAQLALTAAQTRVTLEVNNLFRKLEAARALVRVSQLAVDSSREKLRVATNRFTNQAAMLKDVLTAQSALAEGSNNYQQALSAYWKARAEFERAIGKE